MIPTFPEFKKLELSDKKSVEVFTKKFLPYSDFNFTSMWTWNGRDTTQLSQLEGNLIVKFSDYLTDEVFFSFLGINKVNEVAEKLLELAEIKKISHNLRFVPEEAILNLDRGKFEVDEDRDNFDYILDNRDMIDYKGRALHNHANFKKRFLASNNQNLEVKVLNLHTNEHKEYIETLHELWIKNKIFENKETSSDLESIAINRMFDIGKSNDNYNLIAFFLENKIVAFCIDEILNEGYSIRHFMKADTAYKGIYSFLVSEDSRVLINRGSRFCNIEQDLGLKNLRQSKKSFNPYTFLRKYTVSKRIDK